MSDIHCPNLCVVWSVCRFAMVGIKGKNATCNFSKKYVLQSPTRMRYTSLMKHMSLHSKNL